METVEGAVRVVVDEGVATITLDRPAKRNALTAAMQRELAEAVRTVGADDSARVLVLRGEGRSFCAGVDIKEPKVAAPSRPRAMWQREVGNILAALTALPVPVIAAVRGHALGRGLDLVVAADLRIVAPSARLGYPEIARGMIVGGGGPRRLARLIGESRAAELLLCGTTMDSSAALECGLATRSATEEQLDEVADACARDLAKLPALALYMAKTTLRQSAEVSAAAGAWTDSAFNVLGLSE